MDHINLSIRTSLPYLFQLQVLPLLPGLQLPRDLLSHQEHRAILRHPFLQVVLLLHQSQGDLRHLALLGDQQDPALLCHPVAQEDLLYQGLL